MAGFNKGYAKEFRFFLSNFSIADHIIMESRSNPEQAEKRFLLARRVTFGLLSVILIIYGFVAIRNFLYPIAFGFVLGYLLFPLGSWLEKRGIPRILANFIIIFSALALLAGLFLAAYRIISPLTLDFPKLAERAIDNVTGMGARLGGYFGFDEEGSREYIRDQATSLAQTGGEQLQTVFNATANTIIAFGLLPVYLFLFLYYRTKFMYFILKLAGRSRRKETVAILREIATVMVRYLGGVIIVVFILFFINSGGLLIIGMPLAIPLGVTAALFNFIPYFGTLLGGLVPLMFAFLVEGDPALALRVIFLFIIIQFIENNILTPNIVGGNVNLSPFFVITGLVAASMIWGIPGMLLLVPFLASVRILFSHIGFMRPYAFLLGEEGTSKHSIQMGKIKRIFKKILQKVKNRS
jgi:predicted PurR-regulated permease PerM